MTAKRNTEFRKRHWRKKLKMYLTVPNFFAITAKFAVCSSSCYLKGETSL